MIKTLPDKEYPAEVIWIDGWARDRNAKLADADAKAQGLAGVRVFDVEVELLESDTERLRDGFQARVEFPGDTRKSVLSLPLTAIVHREGGTFVQVQPDGGAPEWRKVETDLTGRRAGQTHAPGQRAGDIIIKSGVNAGERVLLQGDAQAAKPQGDKKIDTTVPSCPRETRRRLLCRTHYGRSSPQGWQPMSAHQLGRGRGRGYQAAAVVAVLFLGALAVYVLKSGKTESAGDDIRTVRVERRKFSRVVRRSGALQPLKEETLFARVSGTIKELIPQGTIVKERPAS